MSNLGKWDSHYADVIDAAAYGDSESYRLGATWLAKCPTVEDWGCGLGWFRQFLAPEQIYVGVDGSHSKFADVVADLEVYRSSTTAGLFMRHVLEHNRNWRPVLANALASFTKRMVLVIFTPWQQETTELRVEGAYGDVPTIGFARKDIIDALDGVQYVERSISSRQTFYGVEHLFLIGGET